MLILISHFAVAALFFGLGILARPRIVPWLEHMGFIEPTKESKDYE